MARARKMTEGSVVRHLIAYALPLILGNFFQLTYNALSWFAVCGHRGSALGRCKKG